MENKISQTEPKEIILEVVKGLMDKMGLPGEIEIKESQEESKNITCNIKTPESKYLIGQYGVNLQAFQHIARVIVRKKTKDKTNFVVDVNFYRQEKNESITALAKNMAEQAILEKRAVVLHPMSSYERRIIHLELSQNKQVATESIGEGDDRRVVIKPKELVL